MRAAESDTDTSGDGCGDGRGDADRLPPRGADASGHAHGRRQR
jgi:hypothetical protein